MITFLLITIAAVGSLTGAALHAYEALKAFAEGNLSKGFKHTVKAGWEGRSGYGAVK